MGDQFHPSEGRQGGKEGPHDRRSKNYYDVRDHMIHGRDPQLMEGFVAGLGRTEDVNWRSE